MKSHRRKRLILLACGILTLALVWVLLGKREPRYQGRTLSYWLERREQFVKARRPSSAGQDESQKAILTIGTNAIPWLLAWIRYEPNPVPQSILNRVLWSYWSTPVGNFIRYGYGSRNSRAENVVLAFDTLGTNAAPALPGLILLMKDRTHPLTSVRATMALGCLGPHAFPALAEALFSTNQHERQLVALQLFEMSHDAAVGTNKVLPFVVRAMHDPDPMVSNYAARVFARIAPATLTNAPPP